MVLYIPGHEVKPDGTIVWATGGDAYIRVVEEEQEDVQPAYSRAFQVSTEVLKKATPYFAAAFSEQWSAPGAFTATNPLVLRGDNIWAMSVFLGFLHFLDLVPQVLTLEKARSLAAVCNKYMYKGPVPAWISEYLQHFLKLRLPEDLHDFDPRPLPDVLYIACVLNLPLIFTKASSRMMWFASRSDIANAQPNALWDLVPVNLIEAFKAEFQRLRDYLPTKLPSLWFPDPHGNSEWWCPSCSVISHTERWYLEVIHQTPEWELEQSGQADFSLAELASSWSLVFDDYNRYREMDHDGTPIPCGRFRLRYADISREEVQTDLYVAIGGICLACFRAGKFKYDVFCPEHKMCLVVD